MMPPATGLPGLWLVRHAQPLVERGLCYGALDVPSDAKATQDAAQVLAHLLPLRVNVVCSPLQRCELLAQVLYGLRPDLVYTTDARLTEMNFGFFEGQRWDCISAQAYDDWIADFWQHRFGGTESVADVMTRVASAWDEAMCSDKSQVWITHAGVIRAATLLAQGVRRVDRAQHWPQEAPAFGQWVVLPGGGQAAS